MRNVFQQQFITLKQKSKNQFIKLTIPTKDGSFIASYSGKGLVELNFPSRGRAELPVSRDARQRVPTEVNRWHRMTVTALKRTLTGRASGALPPLDLSSGTDFQRSVWNSLRKIRSGQTQSYGEIACAIGKSKAVRAVGGACGANPIPVLIPCHRVLAANRKLGGFSGGLNWKRALLAREGITTKG